MNMVIKIKLSLWQLRIGVKNAVCVSLIFVSVCFFPIPDFKPFPVASLEFLFLFLVFFVFCGRITTGFLFFFFGPQRSTHYEYDFTVSIFIYFKVVFFVFCSCFFFFVFLGA